MTNSNLSVACLGAILSVKHPTKLLDIEVMSEVVQLGLNMLLQDTNLHCKLQRCAIVAEVNNRLLAAIFPTLHVTHSV